MQQYPQSPDVTGQPQPPVYHQDPNAATYQHDPNAAAFQQQQQQAMYAQQQQQHPSQQFSAASPPPQQQPQGEYMQPQMTGHTAVPQPGMPPQQPSGTVYQHATAIANLNRGPAPADCPACGQRAMTNVAFETGNTTQYVSFPLS
jgi:lipopolysaccharide-induced tumor necrosis factor-alpha factor